MTIEWFDERNLPKEPEVQIAVFTAVSPEEVEAPGITANLLGNLVTLESSDFLPADQREAVSFLIGAKKVSDLDHIKIDTMINSYRSLLKLLPAFKQEVNNLLAKLMLIPPAITDVDYI